MMDLKLNKKTMKALSSGTRVEILKILKFRRHTQAEVATILGLAVPTVRQHLHNLEGAGLVERHDEGRKWKYFSLTKRGKAVLQPEQTRIMIVLSALVLGVIGTLWSWPLAHIDAPPTIVQQESLRSAPYAMEAAADAAPAASKVAVQSASDASLLPYVFAAIVIVSLIALIYLLVRQERHKERLLKIGGK